MYFLLWPSVHLTAFPFCVASTPTGKQSHSLYCLQQARGFEKRTIIKIEGTAPTLTKHDTQLERSKHILLFSVCASISLAVSLSHTCTHSNGKTLKNFQISSIQHTPIIRVSACAKDCAGFWRYEGEKDVFLIS